MVNIQEVVLDLLVSVCEEEELRSNKDIELFEAGLLDSMRTIELLVEVEEKLNLQIPITEFEREEWSTPNKIISFIEQRLPKGGFK